MFLSKRSFCRRRLGILFLQIWIFFHHFEISLFVTNSPSKSLHYYTIYKLVIIYPIMENSFLILQN